MHQPRLPPPRGARRKAPLPVCPLCGSHVTVVLEGQTVTMWWADWHLEPRVASEVFLACDGCEWCGAEAQAWPNGNEPNRS